MYSTCKIAHAIRISVRTTLVKDDWELAQFGLVVWLCSGQKLPAHPSSLYCMDKSRESRNNPQCRQNRNNINVLQISLRFNNLM